MQTGAGLPAGYSLSVHETLDSTNEEARRRAVEGAPDGTVVWARRQTAGRGRQGRRWMSPEGNLYCTIILRPDAAPAAAAQLSFVTALALGGAVAELLPGGVELRYKWPNDLLLDGRKTAGILLESSGGRDGRLDWIVVGAGLNLASHPEIGDGGYPATSLREVGARPVAVEEVLARYLAQFDHWRARWRAEGFGPLRDAWLARAARLGEAVTVRLPAESLQGRFSDLDGEGALLLDLADGTRRTVSAGDVFF